MIGFGLIQITISNVVYPMLQARSLSLSPVAVVVALAFWSWLWGLAGALSPFLSPSRLQSCAASSTRLAG